ncbi:metallophosphoesterase family protein [Corynebacterium sp. S7]
MVHIAAFADLHLGAAYSPGSQWVKDELQARQAEVVVFAGDLFDRHTATETNEHEGAELMRWITQTLQTPVVMIWGNHDVAKGFEFHTRFPRIDGVYRPASFDVEELRVPGIPLAFHAVNVKKKRDERLLIDDFPTATGPGHVGVFHTGLDGSYTNNNCLPATESELREKNYATWIMGHVHKPTTLSREPYIGWPGVGVMEDLHIAPLA